MKKSPAEIAAEKPVGDEAALAVNGGVSSAGARKPGPPKVGDDAWLPS